MSAEQVSARDIVRALKGHWYRGYGVCPCPAHGNKSDALSVCEKYNRVLVKCFAGCPQDAVLDALRARGLWPSRDDFGIKREFKPRTHPAPADLDEDEQAAMRAAREIWRNSRPIGNDPARLYLWSRGLGGYIPPSLRFHPALYNTEVKRPLPALVGAIQDGGGRITAIQRIWVRSRYACENGVPLQPNMKADVKVAKKTLGPMGDGAVRLARIVGMTLGIAEGIETALAARALYSLPVWAVLGAPRLGRITIPECVGRIIIFADNGEVGEKAAERAREGYEAQGLETIVEFPPPEFSDFNEWLQSRQS